MFKKSILQFSLSFALLAAICVFFYACEQKESIVPQDSKIEQTVFQKYQAEHTQHITAPDLGHGTYEVIGAAGTIINIKNALVDTNGDRVSGDINIELIEIYTIPEMILHRKQTLADQDGQFKILESGGEIFLKIYQNGKELSVDGNGEMSVLLPTENTGGAKENMGLYYGQEIGAQVIWKPTGEKIEVVNLESRNGDPYYLVIIQETLGWINVDKLNSAGGDDVDCIEVYIDCDEICQPNKITVSMYVRGLSSAFEVPGSGNSFKLCGPFPLGGIKVSFIVTMECPDGSFYVSIRTVIINAGNHQEVFKCDKFVPMAPDEFKAELQKLL